MQQTKTGYNLDECQQALVICLRRGIELNAMEFALELMDSGQTVGVWEILFEFAIIDIGVADNDVLRHMYDLYESFEKMKNGNKNSALGLAILRLCRAVKSREATDLAMLANKNRMDGCYPTLPAAAVNVHTERGKKEIHSQAKKKKVGAAEIARRRFVEDWGRVNNPSIGLNSADENHTENLWDRYDLQKEADTMLNEGVTGYDLYKAANINPDSKVKSLGDGMYEVDSSSDPSAPPYTVDLSNKICNCKAFKHGGGTHCKHIIQVMKELRGEHHEPQ